MPESTGLDAIPEIEEADVISLLDLSYHFQKAYCKIWNLHRSDL